MSNKAKKPFSLVNLRSIKELSKKQQETIAKEEERELLEKFCAEDTTEAEKIEIKKKIIIAYIL